MKADVALKEAGLVHARVMAAVHERCFTHGWDGKALLDLLAMPGAFALLAVEGDRPHGFILCRVAADECEVITLGVVPEFRGVGLGRRLLEGAAEQARRFGAVRMFLEVAEDNGRARRLYDGAGYREMGRRPGYYPRENAPAADALILALRLS